MHRTILYDEKVIGRIALDDEIFVRLVGTLCHRFEKLGLLARREQRVDLHVLEQPRHVHQRLVLDNVMDAYQRRIPAHRDWVE